MRTIRSLGVSISSAAIVAALLCTTSTALAQTRTSSANFSQGESVVVSANVNVRSSAAGSIVTQELRGSTGTLVGGPVNTNGYTWWQIKYSDGVVGWTAEDFLQKSTVALQTPSASVVAVSTTNANTGSPSTNSNAALTANASGAVNSNLLSSLQAELNSLLAQIASLKAGQ